MKSLIGHFPHWSKAEVCANGIGSITFIEGLVWSARPAAVASAERSERRYSSAESNGPGLDVQPTAKAKERDLESNAAKLYTNTMLTIIVALLLAIVAKLYVSAFDDVGTHIGAVTRADIQAAAQIADPDSKRRAMVRTLDRTPRTSIVGEVEVTGQVSVDGPVEIQR